jgi:hypothetical protein
MSDVAMARTTARTIAATVAAALMAEETVALVAMA